MASIGLVTLLGALPLAASVVQDWYVDVNAPGCGAGTGTQLDPFCDIMDAVNAASDGDTIHIAPGTYFENVVLDEDLELVGSGGQQVTILDGSASGSVVRIGSTSIVTLTGLTLTNGSGTVLYGTTTSGGGLFAYDLLAAYDSLPSVTMANCTVTANSADWGGGVYFVSLGPSWGSDGRLTLEQSKVSDNVGGQVGGMFSACALTVRDSLVAGNSGPFCGGVLSQFGSLTLTNSTVVGNTATAYAGGVEALSGTCVVVNSTVVGNTGGGIQGYCSLFPPNCNTTVMNSILSDNGGYANVHAEYSLIPGGSGTGNIDADPLFIDALGMDGLPATGDEDYRLLPASPCIDAGNNLAVPLDLWTDLDGKFRFLDDPLTPDTGHPGRLLPIVDMGAHEFGVDPPRRVRRR